jgi:protein-S-isoprenylcysteine O-methyltransferase Ste14
MKIIGKTTIHPFLFYSGKTAGYLLWIFLALNLFNIPVIDGMRHPVLKIISVIILLLGLALTAVSLFNLGKSTSLGVPDEDTTLKTDGLYRFSRNPMYLGFNCITIAALLFNVNLIFLFLGGYCIIIYHLIILGEERFLENRFGGDYRKYKSSVRRYI